MVMPALRRHGAPFNTAGLNVRITPNSGHWNSVTECPLCAKSGHEQIVK
jgi:hypothetical protein